MHFSFKIPFQNNNFLLLLFTLCYDFTKAFEAVWGQNFLFYCLQSSMNPDDATQCIECTVVKKVPILNHEKKICCNIKVLTHSLHHNKRSQSNENCHFTKECPWEGIEVGYFWCWNRKTLKIPIKIAIFRLKISYEQGVAG